jgi:hypothetical protein
MLKMFVVETVVVFETKLQLDDEIVAIFSL